MEDIIKYGPNNALNFAKLSSSELVERLVKEKINKKIIDFFVLHEITGFDFSCDNFVEKNIDRENLGLLPAHIETLKKVHEMFFKNSVIQLKSFLPYIGSEMEKLFCIHHGKGNIRILVHSDVLNKLNHTDWIFTEYFIPRPENMVSFKVFLRAHKSKNDQDSTALDFRLRCASVNQNVKFKISFINWIHSDYSKTAEIEYLFKTIDDTWHLNHYLDIKKLCDPKKGYLNSNSYISIDLHFDFLKPVEPHIADN